MGRYGGLNVFFGGLEGMVGSPNAAIAEAMAFEHTELADSNVEFMTGRK